MHECNLYNVYSNLTYNSPFFFLFQKNQEGLGVILFIGFVGLGLNCFIIPNYMMSYSENKRHIEK